MTKGRWSSLSGGLFLCLLQKTGGPIMATLRIEITQYLSIEPFASQYYSYMPQQTAANS